MAGSIRSFRDNRARFSIEELKKLQEKWVAFSSDGDRIVASASTIAELEAKLSDLGENPENVGLEWIELTDVSLGGAELM